MRVATLAVFLTLLRIPADARWWRVEAGPLVVYTDAGEQAGLDLARRLELARRLFSTTLLRGRPPIPVVAFGLKDTNRFRSLRPTEITKGFYQGAAERDYIVVHLENKGVPARVAFHEYAHLALNHASGPLPPWLEEGFSEVYSTVEERDGKVRLGAPVPEHLRLLARTPLLAASELGAVSKESPVFSQAHQAGIFYAQSWAVAHYLLLDQRNKSGCGGLLAALQAEPAQAALQRTCGRSLTEIVAELRPYVSRTMLPVIEFVLPVEPVAEAKVSPVEDWEGDLAYAELALGAGHPEVAEKVYRKWEKVTPDSAVAATRLGLMALARKREDEALRLFEQAMQMPGTPATAPFEYAMLLREKGEDRGEVRRHLQRAVDLNPQLAEAQYLLGLMDAADSRHAEAIGRFERALAVLPRQSPFWRALAESYEAVGEKDQARAAAHRALDAAQTSEDQAMASGLLRQLESGEAPKLKTRPKEETPAGWQNKQGAERVAGILERIDCLGPSARIHVRTEGRLRTYWVEKPGEVLLKNASSMTFTFRCGVQQPVAVAIEFEPKVDAERLTSGVITGIEFR
ncbi:MAG: tetratricopeptide repeat protein [Bryobacterales bacterium]|nr:tetratricopeptide repeat protein [Bryobacterales bacterium]